MVLESQQQQADESKPTMLVHPSLGALLKNAGECVMNSLEKAYVCFVYHNYHSVQKSLKSLIEVIDTLPIDSERHDMIPNNLDDYIEMTKKKTLCDEILNSTAYVNCELQVSDVSKSDSKPVKPKVTKAKPKPKPKTTTRVTRGKKAKAYVTNYGDVITELNQSQKKSKNKKRKKKKMMMFKMSTSICCCVIIVIIRAKAVKTKGKQRLHVSDDEQ